MFNLIRSKRRSFSQPPLINIVHTFFDVPTNRFKVEVIRTTFTQQCGAIIAPSPEKPACYDSKHNFDFIHSFTFFLSVTEHVPLSYSQSV